MTEKPAKPVARKPTSSRKPSTRRRKPDQGEISKRAYFIYLEQGGCDPPGNWLRAERELAIASRPARRWCWSRLAAAVARVDS
jgi:hypothetical protein